MSASQKIQFLLPDETSLFKEKLIKREREGERFLCLNWLKHMARNSCPLPPMADPVRRVMFGTVVGGKYPTVSGGREEKTRR